MSFVKTITSRDNPTYKGLLGLAKKKNRDKEGRYLVEGWNLTQEALKAGLTDMVVLREGVTLPTDLLSQQEEAEGKKLPRILQLPIPLFTALADTETSQGILGVVRKKPLTLESFQKILQSTWTVSNNIVIMDGIQDPGNLGTIVRTAAAAGYAGGIIRKGSADIYGAKALRAAAGAVLRFPLMEMEDPQEIAAFAENMGLVLTGTTPEGGLPYRQVDLRRGTALIIGSEGQGMSPEMRALTQRNVYIPMAYEMESLNAAVAAGILLYEALG